MRPVLLAVLLLLTASCESSSSKRSNPQQPQRAPQADIPEQVSAQEAASLPGPMHKKLDPLIGDWQTTIVQVGPEGMEIPGGTGVTRITQLFGGRYQRWDSVIEVGGKRREMTGWLGYDRNAQEYQLSMIMSFSSGMAIYRGQGDLAKDGIVFVLEQMDPKTGAHLRSKNRLKLLTPDHFVSETVDEDMVAQARTHYRRVKAEAK